jgi:DNA-binding response OmpR family regulator
MAEGASVADAHRILAERIESGTPLITVPAPPPPRLLILLAESDPYAAEFGEYFLKTEGFDVQVALGAEAAREAFAAGSPSVMIVEVLISGGVGLKLCRFFRQHGDGTVVVVSTVEARDAAMEAGADAFLHKPLDPLQLVFTVRDLLRRSAIVTDQEGRHD